MRMTNEPSAICKDGTAEGSKNEDHGQPTKRSNQILKWGRPGTGECPTVGHALVHQPRGEDEKIARSWDHRSCVVLDDEIVMLQVHQQGGSLSYSAARPGREESQGWDHSTNHGKRSMARSLWICPRRAGPAAEEKQEDDQGRQADRKTDRKGGRVGEGGTTGRGRPQQAR